MSTPRRNRPNLADQDRLKLLDRLDAQERSAAKKPRRASARLEYRVAEVPLVAVHPGGGTSAFVAMGRNISCGGISVLLPAFLHFGSEARLALVMPGGGQQVLVGRVTFCRLVSGQVHEVGIKFDKKIDPALFCGAEARATSDDPEARAAMEPIAGNSLLVSGSAAERKVISALLKAFGSNPTAVGTSGSAIDQTKLLDYAVLVCDLAGLDTQAGSFVAAARSAGYKGALVALVRADHPEDAASAGAFDASVTKPLERSRLHSAIRSAIAAGGAGKGRGGPVRSTLTGDQGTDEMVKTFIRQARETAVSIESAIKRSDAEAARKTLRGLKSIAGGYGFPSLVEACRQALATLEPSGTIVDAERQLRAVIELCGRLAVGSAQSRAA